MAPKFDSEAEVTLGLLPAINGDDNVTQRSIADSLGIALGLVNVYIKRCAKKGFIKIKQAPRNRFAYYLTPKGFSEKSRLTAEFLAQSLNLFRQAQQDYVELLEVCANRDWRRLALCGATDLVEIFSLYARDFSIEIVGIIDAERAGQTYFDLPVVGSWKDLRDVDAYILSDLSDPQAAYDALAAEVGPERVQVPKMFEVIERDNLPGGRKR